MLDVMRRKETVSPAGAAVWHVALTVLRATLREFRSLALSLFTPLLMLIVFWLADPDSLALMAPLALTVTVAFAGVGLAQRLVSWRAQGAFRRLAGTPVPLGQIALGVALSQLVVTLLQTAAVLAFTVLALQVDLAWSALPLALAGTVASAACFIAYGALIAGLVRRSESATTLFMFTFMPAFFLGMDFMDVPAPVAWIGARLPPALFNRVMGVFFGGPALDAPLALIAGLLAYTALFTAVTLRTFRVR